VVQRRVLRALDLDVVWTNLFQLEGLFRAARYLRGWKRTNSVLLLGE
jgi:hypothetical protein